MLHFTHKSWYVDVLYQGVPSLIACGVLETEDGFLLVDPGPTVSLPTLLHQLEKAGIGLQEVCGILLTHIHLDHAGATGSIVAANPAIQVYVHEHGARHMIHPEKLVASAQRLFGDKMDTLWGAFVPVPSTNVHALTGGEKLSIGGRSFEVTYTPGHAIHQVAYLDSLTATAFVGDTAGMRVTGTDFLVPVTPPPDVDLEAWHTSLDTLRVLGPETLFLTHFGPSTEVTWTLDEMTQKLRTWGEEVRLSLEKEGTDEAHAQTFHQEKMAQMRQVLTASERIPYEHLGQPAPSWHGIARYWRKKTDTYAKKTTSHLVPSTDPR